MDRAFAKDSKPYVIEVSLSSPLAIMLSLSVLSYFMWGHNWMFRKVYIQTPAVSDCILCPRYEVASVLCKVACNVLAFLFYLFLVTAIKSLRPCKSFNDIFLFVISIIVSLFRLWLFTTKPQLIYLINDFRCRSLRLPRLLQPRGLWRRSKKPSWHKCLKSKRVWVLWKRSMEIMSSAK